MYPRDMFYRMFTEKRETRQTDKSILIEPVFVKSPNEVWIWIDEMLKWEYNKGVAEGRKSGR